MKLSTLIRFAVTAIVVLVAALVGHTMWKHYMYSPWTRDGRVRAEIVRIAPDVAGLVTDVRVIDNQTVKKGDILFVVDRARYENAVAQAKANLNAAEAAARAAGASINAASAGAEQSKANYEMYQAQSERRQKLINNVISAEDKANAAAAANAAKAGWQQTLASTKQASAAQQQSLAAVAQAQVELASAQLNLDRTEVLAPVDGFVTNLDVRVGDYANAGTPRLALIDSHSYWIYGYFEETKLPGLRIGDPVDIRLMSGGVQFKGSVESIARGITDADNPTGSDLLADVNPTFNWVRLAQRVPVRVKIDADHLPAGTVLSAGMTATLIVHPSHPDAVAAR
ncbi:efflux transporter periplasmic adaptor subunit [Luteibacter rhizovicinus DSM 16549]|uniref:Efflux transporter periplasmic adaptor subunit n=1 Tax=Luteibacter rhizovicinus DSM 16549 TaxID=1440763 RepID=A0A0G9HK49_9GAMM|nr:HlyD family secretion protein [Luteibacter rhizovicinus]APG03436.1 efflux transporter periplasmic adaptor subunit [Luteibacter rhizovicinus DSM 16549]KLD68082.1 membrane protein [Luteibacter rhizovicinus DSM 16549]